MIDANLLKDNLDLVAKKAEAKGYPINKEAIKKFIEEAKKLQTEIEGLRARRNQLNEKLSKERDAKTLKEAGDLKEKLASLEKKIQELSGGKDLLLSVPNLPADDVKEGKDETD